MTVLAEQRTFIDNEFDKNQLAYIKRRFKYVQSSGEIFDRKFKGRLVTTTDKHGYIEIKINDKRIRKGQRTIIYGHRLAWFMVHGYFSPLTIDHKDQDRLNNRIDNLIEATAHEQCLNRCIAQEKQSKHRFVTWYKTREMWRARVYLGNKKYKTLGYTHDEDEAARWVQEFIQSSGVE